MSYPRRVRRRPIRRVLQATAAGLLLLAGWTSLPVDPSLLAPSDAAGVTLLDRFGASLRTSRAADGSRQTWLPLERMDPDLLVAFVAAEDRRFYDHHGVDPLALARATRANLAAGRVVSGASTITMQLARLLLGTPRTWFGKVAQAAWALRLDRRLSKQVILEQYLNRVPLGQSAVGVAAAARLYFDAGAEDLSLAQAAMLAGLAHAPSRDNPFVSLVRAAARRDRMLDRLERAGADSRAGLARAREEPTLGSAAPARFAAPHFTSWVLARGDSARSRSAVRTSLDLPLQQSVEAEVRHTVATMRSFGAEQAAAVVLDNPTGEILAWVGSPDFFEADAGQVDMVVSARQPGSALKPFLYGLAFDRGLTPATVLHDVATVYRTATGPYLPRNYDRAFHGPVRIREALGSSYNVPAVETVSRVGVAAFLETLHRAGFASLGRPADHYGLGLALGNGDVTLLELANGYRAIATGGLWRPVRWRTGDGSDAGPGVRVMSRDAAVQVLDVLADPMARVPAFGPSTPLDFAFRAAAKTGTSRHFTDNWAVVTTARFTVAVWVGNFNGRPMAGVSGITGAGPLVQRIVLATAARYQPGQLPLPSDAGLVPVTICRLSGLEARHECPSLTEWFRPGTAPAPDDWYTAHGLALPEEFADWSGARVLGNAVTAAGARRRATDSAAAGFRITSPRNGDRYRFVPGVALEYATVGLRAAGAGRAVRWFIDGRPHWGPRWAVEPGIHRIRAVAGRDEDEVAVEVLP